MQSIHLVDFFVVQSLDKRSDYTICVEHTIVRSSLLLFDAGISCLTGVLVMH